jgi:hypothetical protein
VLLVNKAAVVMTAALSFMAMHEMQEQSPVLSISGQ